MFWAMWAVFALAILAIGLGLLYLAFGVKHIETKGSEEKYEEPPPHERDTTGESDKVNHDYKSTG